MQNAKFNFFIVIIFRCISQHVRAVRKDRGGNKGREGPYSVGNSCRAALDMEERGRDKILYPDAGIEDFFAEREFLHRGDIYRGLGKNRG